MQHPIFNALLAIGLFIAVPTSTLGLPEDREKPIQLEANRAQLDQKTGTSIYEGDVVITQGSMRLTANTVTIYTRDGTFQRMEAVGNPATLRYKPAVDKPEMNGVSQRVDYDAVAAKVVMTTNARITQGQDVFTGNRIEYDLGTDVVKARGKEGGRVQFTIQPRAQQN